MAQYVRPTSEFQLVSVRSWNPVRHPVWTPWTLGPSPLLSSSAFPNAQNTYVFYRSKNSHTQCDPIELTFPFLSPLSSSFLDAIRSGLIARADVSPAPQLPSVVCRGEGVSLFAVSQRGEGEGKGNY